MRRPGIEAVRRMADELENQYREIVDADASGELSDMADKCLAYVTALRWAAGYYGADGIPNGMLRCIQFDPERDL